MRFLYEFLSQFFKGIELAIVGIFNGIKQIFNIKGYAKVVEFYREDFNGPEWVFVLIAIILIALLLGLIIFLAVFLIRKYIRFRKTIVEQEELLNEVSDLNNEVSSLLKEKEDILAMKVSHLGLKPGESETEEVYRAEWSDSRRTSKHTSSF